MQPNKKKVAVIGPFYNSCKHVRPWLEGLSKQIYDEFQVYLVDDCSQDGTKEEVEKCLKVCELSLEYVRLEKNSGPSAARNIAIKKAMEEGAELILLLDSDCRVQSDWVLRHVDLHQKKKEISVIGGGIQGVAETAVGKADGFCSWFSAVPYSKSRSVEKLHLSTTNMSIKTSVFRTIGYFDETLATGEDVVFCRKLQQAGLKLWLQSDIVIRHLDRNDFTSAKRHHYRWGLHSFTISNLEVGGGYYEVLSKIPVPGLVALLVPVIAFLNVVFILFSYSRYQPKVWLYLPWIIALKWENAVGVYKGYRAPDLCLLKASRI